MTRSIPGAMALSFILAASVASPASAANAALDSSFGDEGIAYTNFGGSPRLSAPLTIGTPDGGTVTAVVNHVPERVVAARAGAPADDGLIVVWRDAAGQEIDRRAYDGADGNEVGEVFDLRYVGEDLVIAGRVGDEDDGEDAGVTGFTVLAAPDNSDDYTARHDIKECDFLADASVLSDGDVAFAAGCGPQGTQIDVEDPHPRGRVVAPSVDLDDVSPIAMDVDSEDRLLLAYRADNGSGVTRLRSVGEESWQPFVIDAAFGFVGTPGVQVADVSVDTEDRAVVGGMNPNLMRAGGPSAQDDLMFTRVDDTGALDGGFGAGGVAGWSDGSNDTLTQFVALATDDQDRVIATTTDSYATTGTVRLTEGGAPDESYGPNGVFELTTTQYGGFSGRAPVFSTGGATYVGSLVRFVAARDAQVPATPQTRVALVRIKDPATLATPGTPQTDQQQQTQQTQQQATPAPVVTPVATTAPSTSTRRTARTCVSRRTFTIRLRPRSLKSATVRVAGKKVKTTRKDGRLTAKIDLRKLQQASFTVKVSGRTAAGRKVSETRTYRTCRVGENGPKVKGGSVVITVGA